MKGGRARGTDVRGGIDARALSEAVARPGIDTRAWVMEGTVCTLDRSSGTCDYEDNRAVWNSPGGVHVDVLLSNGHHVTARYAGVQAGDVTILAPIRPGDPVVVQNPGGSLMACVIVAILHTRSNRQPTDGGKPIFDNNRLLIHAKDVPIDIRTAGTAGNPGVQLFIGQDGTIRAGNQDATEQNVLGTSYRQAEDQLLDAMEKAAQSLASAAAGPYSGLTPGFTMLVAAFEAFKLAATATKSFLSDVVFTK
jgi:hypothetical protein